MTMPASDAATGADATPVAPESASLLDAIVAATPPQSLQSVALIGECIAERHPVFAGRVSVRWKQPGISAEREAWLFCLSHLSVRCGDRVLLTVPANGDEPIVCGVIDGLHAHAPQRHSAQTLTLKADETLDIHAADGSPLLRIHATPGGPQLHLLTADMRLSVEGALELSAHTVSLRSAADTTLVAGGDVTVRGENIALN